MEWGYGFNFSSIVIPRRACLENLVYSICLPFFIFQRCINRALMGDEPFFVIADVLMHFWRLSHTLMHMIESVYACAMSRTRGSRDLILFCCCGLIYHFYPLNSPCVECPLKGGGKKYLWAVVLFHLNSCMSRAHILRGPQWDGHTAVQMRHSCIDHETPWDLLHSFFLLSSSFCDFFYDVHATC
ncbi:hypothetical protein BDV37DRAFT_107748 [Aspergillus pseudonomiae]|uniref:Uncharacterized protein n=1 Tax=Aspergillus pseudonomiae TaxID=1506151 RepID=A0A5N7DF06_9EURO|nr:uncharacterized protein BDV37DRAFT_107748 [Aspergillus pseudonomiae]KAE8404603.1 hypothetical protein BDV37DRAFT_107748 [Aspergillus pseudonomiae]